MQGPVVGVCVAVRLVRIRLDVRRMRGLEVVRRVLKRLRLCLVLGHGEPPAAAISTKRREMSAVVDGFVGIPATAAASV
jgi:hypothetical protein